MRRSRYPSFLILALMMLLSGRSYAGTTYTISSNSSWSAVLPSTCANCIINISNSATLTVNQYSTCQNCTFQGGAIVLNNQTLNIQYTGSLTTTYFNGTKLIASGSSQVVVNAPLSLQVGQVLQEKQAESGAGVIVAFPVGNYAPGLYILSVVGADGFRESRQLMISRS